jgi:hypothetical protein
VRTPLRASTAKRARQALAVVLTLGGGLAAACHSTPPPPPPQPQPQPAPSSAAVAAENGELTPEVTDAVISGAVSGMQACYMQELKAQSSFHPQLVVTLHVMPDGGVGAVKFDQKVPKAFADCMTKTLGTLTFPTQSDQTVDFPLDLSQ